MFGSIEMRNNNHHQTPHSLHQYNAILSKTAQNDLCLELFVNFRLTRYQELHSIGTYNSAHFMCRKHKFEYRTLKNTNDLCVVARGIRKTKAKLRCAMHMRHKKSYACIKSSSGLIFRLSKPLKSLATIRTYGARTIELMESTPSQCTVMRKNERQKVIKMI